MRETKSDEQYCTLTNTNFTKWVGFFPLVLNVFFAVCKNYDFERLKKRL